MDWQGLLDDARTVVAKIEQDPGRYKAALGAAVDAVGSIHTLVSNLHAGDVPAATASIEDFSDVIATIQATQAVKDQNEKDASGLSLDDVETLIAKLLKVVLAVAAKA